MSTLITSGEFLARWLPGSQGAIHCSEPSARLLLIVLEDAVKLGFSRDQKQVERYIRLIEQRIIALPYKTRFTLYDTENLVCRIRLQCVGYILCSVYVEVDLHYSQSGKKKRIVFSGDLGAPHASYCLHPNNRTAPTSWRWSAI